MQSCGATNGRVSITPEILLEINRHLSCRPRKLRRVFWAVCVLGSLLLSSSQRELVLLILLTHSFNYASLALDVKFEET